MFNKLFSLNMEPQAPIHEEGELYQAIEIFGHTFELYYGYYEECDKQNPLCEPIPIYPDLIKNPVYTNEGYPLATDMQDACEYFKGDQAVGQDCGTCQYYERYVDFFGLCKCPMNKITTALCHEKQIE